MNNIEFDWNFVQKLSGQLTSVSNEFNKIQLKLRQLGTTGVFGIYGANIYKQELEDLQVEYLLNGYNLEIQ